MATTRKRTISSSALQGLRRLNPAFKRSVGVHVTRNKDGSMILRPVRRNVAQGYYDATGFHPIRASKDYDPDRAGDEYSDTGRKRKAQAKKAKKRKR